MGVAPNYYESHLLVAAIRLLQHKDGRPPTPQECADLLGLGSEKAFLLMHQLKELTVIRTLESPFDVRMEVIDPVPLEELPREVSESAMKEELDSFHTRSKEKKKKMNQMFQGGEAELRKKERVAKLEEQFKEFQPKPGALGALFGEEGGEDDDEGDPENGE